MTGKHLLVIGGGPGGYAAAFLAADRGMQVTLIDEETQLGGVCLLRGCIPSKTLLHLAKLIAETRHAAEMGLSFGDPKIDLDTLRSWKEKVTSNLTRGLSQLCKQRGIKRIQGRAVFVDSGSVKVEGNDPITFESALIAVGSRPIIPKDWTSAGCRLMDSTGALQLEDIPARLLVVGGGYIGLEMGTVYSALGSQVTVVEMTDGLLPGADRDLVRILQARLKGEFNSIHLNTRVSEIKDTESGLKAVLQGTDDKTHEAEFDRILVSVGRQPNTSGLGLQNTRVEMDERGFVQADADGRTADPAIFAIGDVVGGAMLAHKASHEAKHTIEVLSGSSPQTLQVIPAVVFTDPEIAWCGLTETEAKAKGVEISIAKFPWGASGRAATLGRNDGLTKLIIDPKTDRILGAGLVGVGVGDLISEVALAIRMKATARDLAETVHPHPTLSETLMEAAEVYLGTSTHVYKKPR